MLDNSQQLVNNKLTEKLEKELESATSLRKSIKDLFHNVISFKKQSILNRAQYEAVKILLSLSVNEGFAYARYKHYCKRVKRSLSSWNKYIRKFKDLGIITVKQLYNEAPEIYLNFEMLKELGLIKPDFLSTLFVSNSVDISPVKAKFMDIIHSLKTEPLYILKTKLHPYYLYMINQYLDLTKLKDLSRLSISTAYHLFKVSLFDQYLFKTDKLIVEEEKDMSYMDDYNEYSRQLATNKRLVNTKKAAADSSRLSINSSHHSAAAPNKSSQTQYGGRSNDISSVDSGLYRDVTGIASRQRDLTKFEESKKVAVSHISDILKKLGVRNAQRR